MKISKWLEKAEAGAVLADANSGVVRLWTAPPRSANTFRALRRFFPFLEERGDFLRLGGWDGFLGAVKDLAEAKMTSRSPFAQGLHLVEGRDGEGMRYSPHALLVS